VNAPAPFAGAEAPSLVPPRLVVLAGLPGTGKSALARELAGLTGAPVLDKDRVREALFGPAHVRHAREQDDLVVRALLAAAEDLFRSGAATLAILDGRTFTRRASVAELEAWARERGVELAWVETVASAATARARLVADASAGRHVARDRGPELHDRLAAEAEPLSVGRLTLETERASPRELARDVLAWLATP
jgi:predicted kinase